MLMVSSQPKDAHPSMRKFLALLFLLTLAVVFWYGGRWYASDQVLRATLIFSTPVAVRPGNPVVHDGVRVGEVESVASIDPDRKAVNIKVDREWRHLLRTDSSYKVEAARERAAIEVSSKLAVGPPLSDGAIVPVRANEISKWMSKGADVVRPFSKKVSQSAQDLVAWYESGKFDAALREWKAKVPGWKEQGSDVYERNMASIRERVAAAEQKLRAAKKDVEADRLRAKFDAWVKSLRE